MFIETAEGQIEDSPREVGLAEQEVNEEHRRLEGTGGQTVLLKGGSSEACIQPRLKKVSMRIIGIQYTEHT